MIFAVDGQVHKNKCGFIQLQTPHFLLCQFKVMLQPLNKLLEPHFCFVKITYFDGFVFHDKKTKQQQKKPFVVLYWLGCNCTYLLHLGCGDV